MLSIAYNHLLLCSRAVLECPEHIISLKAHNRIVKEALLPTGEMFPYTESFEFPLHPYQLCDYI